MKIGIIGCGNIGSIFAHRLTKEHELALYDRGAKRLQDLAAAVNVKPSASGAEVVAASDIIILAVKPQHLESVSKEISAELKKNQILISLLAGCTLHTLRHHFPRSTIVRLMPNVAAAYGLSVIGAVEYSSLPAKVKQQIEMICARLGNVYWVTEDKIDALTALTGSGPAFMCVLCEAMIDAGSAIGFNPVQSKALILQMMMGALTVLKESDMHPGTLRWQVTSAEGATIAGIKAMEEAGVRAGIINTFLATYQRAKQIAADNKVVS